MKHLKLLSLLIFILVNIIFISAFKTDENNFLSVKINNTIIKKLPEDQSFIGANWTDDIEITRYIFNDNQYLTDYVKTLKETGINIFRNPGGLPMIFLFWDVPQKELLQVLRNMPEKKRGWFGRYGSQPQDTMNFPTYMEFCKKNRFKTTILVNAHNYYDKNKKEILPLKTYQINQWGNRIKPTGTVNWALVDKAADYAANQVKWVKEHDYNNQVKYWEIGNEDYSDFIMNCGYTGNEYGKVAAVFIKKMTSINPSIKIIITNFVVDPVSSYELENGHLEDLNFWTKDVLSELTPYKNNLYAVSNHIYHMANTDVDLSYENFYKKMTRNRYSDVEKRLNCHKKILNEVGFNNTKIIVNEFNANNDRNPYCHTWMAAIGNAKMIMAFANSPYVDHADFHQLLSNGAEGIYTPSGFALLNFAKDADTPFIKYPVAYVIKLFNENLKNNILESKFDSNNIYVTSSKDNKNLNVILVNKDKKQTVNLDLTDFQNINYQENSSLGTNIPEKLLVIEKGEEQSCPSEVKLLNELKNAISIKKLNGKYMIEIPANTIAVLKFNLNN